VDIAHSIKVLASEFQDHVFVFPVHLNPAVSKVMRDGLSGIHNVKLISPLDYVPFVLLMKRSVLIMTDSGGVQEEAPYFKRPIIVLRETTERPEAVESGHCVLAGTSPKKILPLARKLLTQEYTIDTPDPFGDGHAADRFFSYLEATCS
jgi:UDP-N-acetylglucosamine 2-epimerase (non-hydrolysing)